MNIFDTIKGRFTGGKPPEYTPDVPEAGQESSVQRSAPAVMDKGRIREATEILRKYKNGKASLEARIIENEQWWKLRHWDYMGAKKSDNRPQPASAWLFNSIANKHADAMDNYPEPAVLPREPDDRGTADTLSEVLPVVLEYNNFEDTYSSAWWYKLKAGTACYGVFWNKSLADGIGDVDIHECNILNLFWEPGIKDIQQSRNVFNVAMIDDDVLIGQYPQLKGKSLGRGTETSKFLYDDTVDTSKKTTVIDWYYKKRVGNRDILHFCKFCGDTVLYSSEDAPGMSEGFYAHGEYPFVLDTLFVTEGTPCGYGYIDVMKDTQGYIDRLQQVELEHCVNLQRKRFFSKQGLGINEKEFLDWTNPLVHYTGDISGIQEIKVEPLESTVTNLLRMKIDELKETSGNRDFSQGGTTSGVTAASAIAALQEAGSKLSRDMLKSSYRAFTRVCRLTIELIRQFYDVQRCFRVTGNNGAEFVNLDNSMLNPASDALNGRKPIFDIDVTAQRQSPFSKLSQNELAKEMYQLGFFNPQMCDQALSALDMMNFDGKEEVTQRIGQNGTLAQKLAQMQQTALQLAQIADADRGTTIAQGLAAEINGVTGTVPVGNVSSGGNSVDLTAAASPTGSTTGAVI